MPDDERPDDDRPDSSTGEPGRANGSGGNGHDWSARAVWDAPAWTGVIDEVPGAQLPAVPLVMPDQLPALDPAQAVPAGMAPAAPVRDVVWPAGTRTPSAVPYPVALPGPGSHPPAGPNQGSSKRTHRWGVGAYLLVEAVFLGTSLLLAVLMAGGGPPTAGALAVSLSVPTVLAAGAALLITRRRGNGPRIDLGLQWSWRDVGLGLAFGFGSLVITIPASLLYVAIAGEDTTSAVGKVFGEVRAGPLLAATVFAIVVFLAPLCEEIVYRGLLWGGVEKLGASRWVILAVTTLLFALAHFEFARTPLLLVVALPIGLARLYTGRLLASIVAHQVNNLLPGIALLLMLTGALPSV